MIAAAAPSAAATAPCGDDVLEPTAAAKLRDDDGTGVLIGVAAALESSCLAIGVRTGVCGVLGACSSAGFRSSALVPAATADADTVAGCAGALVPAFDLAVVSSAAAAVAGIGASSDAAFAALFSAASASAWRTSSAMRLSLFCRSLSSCATCALAVSSSVDSSSLSLDRPVGMLDRLTSKLPLTSASSPSPTDCARCACSPSTSCSSSSACIVSSTLILLIDVHRTGKESCTRRVRAASKSAAACSVDNLRTVAGSTKMRLTGALDASTSACRKAKS